MNTVGLHVQIRTYALYLMTESHREQRGQSDSETFFFLFQLKIYFSPNKKFNFGP